MMAVLITRPAPDHIATADALRARGIDALTAPMLRYEPVAFALPADAAIDALLVTSANALRALAEMPVPACWLSRPLYAVGERTAEAARTLGFTKVTAAEGDGASLRDLVVAEQQAKRLKPSATLLYPAAADRAVDLEEALRPRGFHVITVTAYRMVALAHLPDDVCRAFAAGRIDAVLHYSGRSARSFVDAVRAAGLEITALAVPHCCFSANIAAVLREAGATQVAVAQTPHENALFDALDRALRAQSR